MKGEFQELVQYMRETKKIIVPIYQRNYEWTRENCRVLYEDLMMIVNGNRTKHFIGSIVSVKTNDSTNAKIIIDGQQRIITVYLMYLAMYNLIEEGEIETSINAEEIKEEFLIHKFSKEDNKYKIIPTEKDGHDLNLLIDNDIDLNKKSESNIIENYKFFYYELKYKRVSIDKLYKAIDKLGVISITLDHDENPQLIFESLNSTGLALKTSDKVRNFLLMQFDEKKQNRLYEKYWKKIEHCVGDSFENFIKDYLIFRYKKICLKRFYEEFKTFILSSNIEIVDILKDIKYCAEIYRHILNFDTDNENINKYLQYFNFIGIKIIRPFLIGILDLYKSKKISEKELLKIFEILESYLVRRIICKNSSSNLGNIFYTLHNEILKNGENYLTSFKKMFFGTKIIENRFPNDDEFSEKFKSTLIGKNKNQILYILSRLENCNSKEYLDLFQVINGKKKYQIEHIIPQTLSEDWIVDLGANYDKIHNIWLNRIANLTLTAYNPELSNKSFGEKRLLFSESSLKLNKYISNFKKFGLEELNERNDYLLKIAKKIWEYPKDMISFENSISLTLRENENIFTASKLISFSFRGERYEVKSWAEMFNIIIKSLHIEDPTVFYELVKDEKYKNRITVNSADFENLREIEKGKLFYNATNSTSQKIQILRDFFEKFDISQDELIFEVTM